MIRWLNIFLKWFRAVFQTHGELALENLALRQQIAVKKRQQPRPKLSVGDRRFWLFLSRYWSDWRQTLIVVQPDTMIRWHRKGFKYYWTWKSRRKRGRPNLIRDRDAIYGQRSQQQTRALGIQEVLTAPRSPWQKDYASYCTSFVRFGLTSGKRCRRESFLPWILTGGWSPGCSYRHSFLSL